MTLRALWLRLTFPFRKARLDRELRQEIELHVALRAEQLVEAGASRDDALVAARKRFGNRARVADAARDPWGWHWLEGFLQDSRHVARQLRRAPAFVVVVCVTVALGVAVNVTAFTFYDAVVLKPLPVTDAPRVVRIALNRFSSLQLLPFTAYDVLRRNAHVVQAVTATTDPQSFAAVLPGHTPDDSRVVTARFVTPDFARVLGVHARIGRWFDASDDAGVVLDHTFWATALNADPSVIGRTMRIGDATLTILGVVPESFAGTGMPAVAPNLWLPASTLNTLMGVDWRDDGRPHWQILGRLATNGSIAAARAEVTGLSRAIPDSAGKPLPLIVRHATFFQTDSGELDVFQQISLAFVVALVLMLSIAVVNLVNLFAARNAARDTEVTVRLVLGANRRRIAQQLASESLLLALVGGALGLIVSRDLTTWIQGWVTTALSSMSGGSLGVSLDLSIDWRVAAYAFLLSLAIGLVVGLWPALRASRGDVNAILRQGAATASAAVWGKRDILLAIQVASCVVLLTAAGVLLRGMRLASAIDPRFDVDHMLVVNLDDDATATLAERSSRREAIVQRLTALPSVRAVAWTERVPFAGTYTRRITTPTSDITVALDYVDGSYFDAMGIPIVRGRTFTRAEVAGNAPEMVISEAAARRRWPHEDPVGRSVLPSDPFAGPDTTQTYTVIGVVPDIRSQFLSRMNGPSAYYPYGMEGRRGSFLVRARGTPASAMNDVRVAIASISPTIATRAHVVMMRDGPMALQQLMASVPALITLALAFAGLALAAVGIYGVIAQIVTRRRREIGIRLALGAGRRRVVWLIATKTLRPVAWGAIAGGVGACGLSLVLRSLIAMPDAPDLTFGAGAFNPTVLAAVFGLLVVIVTVAVAVPARRAVMIDPVRTLRAD
jgi:putative ABC transport system permease protein